MKEQASGKQRYPDGKPGPGGVIYNPEIAPAYPVKNWPALKVSVPWYKQPGVTRGAGAVLSSIGSGCLYAGEMLNSITFKIVGCIFAGIGIAVTGSGLQKAAARSAPDTNGDAGLWYTLTTPKKERAKAMSETQANNIVKGILPGLLPTLISVATMVLDQIVDGSKLVSDVEVSVVQSAYCEAKIWKKLTLTTPTPNDDLAVDAFIALAEDTAGEGKIALPTFAE